MESQQNIFFTLAQLGPMFAMIMALYYLLVLRPKAIDDREHEELIKSLKRGDGVITYGGVHGKVINSEAGKCQLEIAKNVQITVEHDAILKRESHDRA